MAEKLAKVLFPDLPVLPVLTFTDSTLFAESGGWASLLTSPTPSITLSLAQQWLIAKSNLKANATLIER